MKSYKNYLILLFIIASTIIIGYYLLVYFYFRTPQSSLWIQNCLIKKENIAKQINQPKIVFLAGSNALFGIKTQNIQKEFNIPTINLSVHAGLGIDYILDRAKTSLKSKDLVILPLEYSHYNYNQEFDLTKTSFLMTYDRKYFNNLPIKEKISHIINITPLDMLKSIIEQQQFKNQETDAGYNSNTLNENGDETANIGHKIKPSKFKPINIPEDGFKETYGIKKIIAFNQWCTNNDIKCYIIYPNTAYFSEYKNEKYQEYFNKLEQYLLKNEVIIIGSPDDAFFDKYYIYDTVYHLNSEGVVLRTLQIINMMQKVETTK